MTRVTRVTRGHLLDEGVGVVGRVLAPVVPARARRPRRRRVRPAPAARQGALAISIK